MHTHIGFPVPLFSALPPFSGRTSQHELSAQSLCFRFCFLEKASWRLKTIPLSLLCHVVWVSWSLCPTNLIVYNPGPVNLCIHFHRHSDSLKEYSRYFFILWVNIYCLSTIIFTKNSTVSKTKIDLFPYILVREGNNKLRKIMSASGIR